MLVASAAFGGVRLLCYSLFSSMTVSNKAAFEPLMRHVSQILEDRTKRWVTDNGASLPSTYLWPTALILRPRQFKPSPRLQSTNKIRLSKPQTPSSRTQTPEPSPPTAEHGANPDAGVYKVRDGRVAACGWGVGAEWVCDILSG